MVWLPLVGWAALIIGAFGIGALLRRAGEMPVDAFPPLHAEARLLLRPLLPAVALGLVGVAVLPVTARRLPWRPLLAVAWLGSVGWAVVLQLPDGISRPLTTPTEYLAELPAMDDDPLDWLRGFTSEMQALPTHVKGHPPLPMLVLWTIQWMGLAGPGWAAAFVIAVGGSAAAAIAVTVRVIAGEDVARRAVPFLVLSPVALWIATSMDAFFLGVAAWAVALVAVAAADSGSSPNGMVGRSARIGSSKRVMAAFAGGLLLGSLPYLSYGLLPIFALPLVVLVLTRSAWPVLMALAAGFLVVPAAFTIAGFSWWDGVLGTHVAWLISHGSRRPYGYFLVGNLAVLALLIGPAGAKALPTALRRAVGPVLTTPPGGRGRSGPDGLGWLAAAALAGVFALDLSGVTTGEVERIWIPYAAWVVTVTAVHRPPARTMLLAQTATALVIEAVARSPW
ncbi:glycosyltransferase family 39 protein [Actinoallomurus acanthiterrae]